MDEAREFPASFVRPWKELLQSRQKEQANDFPNHHVTDIDSLIATSSLKSLQVGTGLSIYTSGIIPAILAAKRSVHFVTCYWAASPTLDLIRNALLQLAAARSSSGTSPTLQISIGFSSRGIFQKLLHTSSRDGYVYPAAQWRKLGLPDQDTLRQAGIEMTVKSLFFTPLSVMHPKYVIIDGARAFIPSCNVSWERWFEGCIEAEGSVVSTLLAFHESVWRTSAALSANDGHLAAAGAVPSPQHGDEQSLNRSSSTTPITRDDEAAATRFTSFVDMDAVPTILLPSPHHRNPRFSLMWLFSRSNPPMTPLNAALLTLFANAKRQITILTPNMTSWPVLDALLEALGRGVDVHIRTSKNMMLVEQLVTAGTTTSRCLRRFIKRYRAMKNQPRPSDVEAQAVSPGNLEILYYKPLVNRSTAEDEPVLSHFKMTMVDGEYLVLGSGNMDRASWWTSQELGILFYVPGFEGHRMWDSVLSKRTEVLFQSRDKRR